MVQDHFGLNGRAPFRKLMIDVKKSRCLRILILKYQDTDNDARFSLAGKRQSVPNGAHSCLVSVLVFHGLTTTITEAFWIAIPPTT
jgi:hypothetical protein